MSRRARQSRGLRITIWACFAACESERIRPIRSLAYLLRAVANVGVFVV